MNHEVWAGLVVGFAVAAAVIAGGYFILRAFVLPPVEYDDPIKRRQSCLFCDLGTGANWPVLSPDIWVRHPGHRAPEPAQPEPALLSLRQRRSDIG